MTTETERFPDQLLILSNNALTSSFASPRNLIVCRHLFKVRNKGMQIQKVNISLAKWHFKVTRLAEVRSLCKISLGVIQTKPFENTK